MKNVTFSMLFFIPWVLSGYAQHPIISTKYTADPAPMVHNDTVFLYTTHDEDDADGFKMFDWLLYTSTDMVNWTDHGVIASLKDFKWAKRDNGAWAAQCIERHGKFYLYCPLHGDGIGVLVADSPYGPFKDPLGKRLVETDHIWSDIDPSPFIDDDGQAYLYWGNPAVWYVKLNEDMISYKGEVVSVPMTIESFGKREGNPQRPTRYEEGPWVWKRDGKYYMAYASVCCPEGIEYSMSDSPEGGWKYKGCIMCPTQKTRGNHPGIIDYKGKSYVFGLNYDLLHYETMQHNERRSVSVAPMYYNSDGTIQEVPYFLDTKTEQVEIFNPYRRVEAETMAWGLGLKTDKLPNKGLYVTKIDDGDTLCIRGVDFGEKGAKRFTAATASLNKGGTIEIRLDKTNGQLVGTLKVNSTGSADNYQAMTCRVKGAKGIHDLWFVFRGPAQKNLFNFDWWKFE
jgi:hypothetical protein